MWNVDFHISDSNICLIKTVLKNLFWPRYLNHQHCVDFFPLDFHFSDPNICLIKPVFLPIWFSFSDPNISLIKKGFNNPPVGRTGFSLHPLLIRFVERFSSLKVSSLERSPLVSFPFWKLDFNPIVVVLQPLKTLEYTWTGNLSFHSALQKYENLSTWFPNVGITQYSKSKPQRIS